MTGSSKFGLLDGVFFFGYMIAVLIIGFWVGRREKATIGDYFRAGNRLPWYAIGASIIAAGISSEQFVGEMGYAYKLGMPVVNWEWLVFPALTILLWVFVPIYFRNRVTTMPEYLERRFGPRARTLYAVLIIASYIFANFALVFFTAGKAMEGMWGIDPNIAIAVLAITTGAYTIYGGLESVAWTDFFQCVLLLGGGILVFFAGMAKIGWDLGAVVGTGERAHLIMPASHPEIPWTALVILALSTNVWYYATDQFINQRCLGAKSEWHSKMGVLLAGAIQIVMPLATCFPGMVYYVMGQRGMVPMLEDANDTYTSVVAAVIPAGLRGLVAAAVIGAIMSTISGLVNSTSTMVTLDIMQRWKGRDWDERRLVRFGQFAGTIALVFGACFSAAVRGWDDMFRYCQDIWGPMAAPAVVAFMGGALWKGAKSQGANACLWLSILTVPYTFLNRHLQDRVAADPGFGYLPGGLESNAFFTNSLVTSGGVFLLAVVLMAVCSVSRDRLAAGALSVVGAAAVIWLGIFSTVWTVIAIAVVFFGLLVHAAFSAKAAVADRWDVSMVGLPAGEREKWWSSVWLWWFLTGFCFLLIYIYFW